MGLKDKIREYMTGSDGEMNALDSLFDKALESEGIERTVLLVASGVLDYLAATGDESRRHYELVDDNEEDRTAYGNANMLLGITGELYAAIKLAKCPPLCYALLADVMTHLLYGCVDMVRGEEYSRFVGFVGTARSLGSKLADRVRRSEDEAEPDEDAEPEEEVRAYNVFPPVILPEPEPETEGEIDDEPTGQDC